MAELNENDKAAIAARLWAPGLRQCMYERFCGDMLHVGHRPISAPDMRDPANWSQGLENLRITGYGWALGGEPDWIQQAPEIKDKSFYTASIWGYRDDLVRESYGRSETPGDLAGAIIAALAALYDAEHSDRAR